MSPRYIPPIPGRSAHLGFYGCAVPGRERVVRCAFAGKSRPPESATVACPVCGATHRVALLWRRPVEYDAGVEPEVVIGAVAS